MIYREFSAILNDFGLVFYPASSLAEAQNFNGQGLVLSCLKDNAYDLMRFGVTFKNLKNLPLFLTCLQMYEYVLSYHELRPKSLPFLKNLDIDKDLDCFYIHDEETDEDYYFLTFALTNTQDGN